MAKFGERLYDRTTNVGNGGILLLPSGEGIGDQSRQFIDGESRTYKITDRSTGEFEEGVTGIQLIGRFVRMDRATCIKSSYLLC